MPLDAIVLETNAANTHQNVLLTQAILEREGWRRILLVSSPYHMRRAMMTWKRAAPGIEVLPEPVEASQFYAHERGASLTQIRGILTECAAIVNYWWKGWV